MRNGVAGRGRYQGLRQILRYNRRLYVRTLASVAALLLMALPAPPVWRALLLSGALPALFWVCSSLLVSHYIYDRSPLYNLSWLERCLSQAPLRWVNIHAGLDETSHLLVTLFPSAKGEVLDIYDPREMTQPSIAEARRITSPLIRSTPASWRALPFSDGVFDAAFLIFVAHELRGRTARSQLFHELARVLRIGGNVALIEHSRDWANFLAFGPGFLHFLPKRAWRQAAEAAGLQVRTEISMTPFVCVFVLHRAA